MKQTKREAGRLDVRRSMKKRVTTTFMLDAEPYALRITKSAYKTLAAYAKHCGQLNAANALQRLLTERTDEELAKIPPVRRMPKEPLKSVKTDIPPKYAAKIAAMAEQRKCEPCEIVAGIISYNDPQQRGEVSPHEAARVARWRGLVADAVARCDGSAFDIPTAWFEEIERRPMVDVITDWLCMTRGIGVAHPSFSVLYDKKLDEDYEKEKTRTRNAHEREIVSIAVMHHLCRHNIMLADDDFNGLIKRFYRAGDCGIYAAIERAVRSALKVEVAA